MNFKKLSKRQQERFADLHKVFKIVALGPKDAFKPDEPELIGKLVTGVRDISNWRNGWIGCLCISLWNNDQKNCFHQVKLRLVKNATHSRDL